MKKILLLLFVLSSVISTAQTLRWVKLNSFPSRNTRKEDLCFIDSQTGWVVDGLGYVYKTTNGGYTWSEQRLAGVFNRCIGFTNAMNGFIGIYDTVAGSSAMYRTTNGGDNWFKFMNLPHPKPAGICGIQCVNENVIYAVGRIGDPAIVLKSTNGGNDWFHLSVDTLAKRLVDVKFFSEDTGFVSGGIGNSSISKGIILFTSNGGLSWVNTSVNAGGHVAFWKLQFTGRNFGVASFNHQSAFLQFVKTTDGGITWTLFSQPINPASFTQGIGFVNENLGWIGGSSETFETMNGGQNWSTNNFGVGINRIRFYSDTLGYAGGFGFYKYTADPYIGINENYSHVPGSFRLYQNYPNPFNPSTTIDYELSKTSFVRIKIYNTSGAEVKTILETYEAHGPNFTVWDGTDYKGNDVPSGIYYCVMEIDLKVETKKMLLVR